MSSHMTTQPLIRQIRKNLNLSQEQLARRLGVSTQTISRWERRKFRPSKAMLELLGQFLKGRLKEALPSDEYKKYMRLRLRSANVIRTEMYEKRLTTLQGLRQNGNVRCVDCGKKAGHYDHRDYNQPLDVQPVCESCNCRRGPAIFTFDFS